MASTSETGHPKNVVNFEKLIAACKSFGTKYNPSNGDITITNMETIHDTAVTSLKTLKDDKTPFDNATSARQIGFKPLSKLVTRSVSFLDSTKASNQSVKDAQTIARKLQGRRAETLKNEETPQTSSSNPDAGIEATHISASQMSFDSRIDNLDKLITHFSAEPLYAPNETELKTTTLTAYLSDLRDLNTAVIDATQPYTNSLIARDTILYNPDSGLVDIALTAKDYVKSVYGTTAPEYKKVSKLKFTRPRK